MTSPSIEIEGATSKSQARKTAARNGRRLTPGVQRQRLKDAALKLFATRGFHSSTVRQIAGKVNLQPGILYHYFASKHDLLREICVDFVLRTQAMAETILRTTPDPVDAVAALLHAGVDNAIRNANASQVLRREARLLEHHQLAIVSDVLRLHRENWVKAIEKGNADGTFDVADPRLAAMVIVQIEDIASWYDPHGRLGKESLINQLTQYTLRLLGHVCDERCAERVCGQLRSNGR